MATPVVDPWLDEGTSLGSFDSSYFEDITKTNEELNQADPDTPGEPKPAEEPVVEPAPEPVAAEPVVEPQPEPEPAEPQVTTFDDGSTLTVLKEKGVWKAVLDTNIPGVNPETFKGKTKEELYSRIAFGKVNATRKIRELNREAKLGSTAPTVPVNKRIPATKAYVRNLTPDEIFEYKTLAESDPVAALDYYNEKRYGLKPEDFAQKLNEATTARQLADIKLVADTFVANNPDYYRSEKNFYTIIRYLVKKYLGRDFNPAENLDALTIELLESGVWTAQNLEEAKEVLTDSELLDPIPAPPQPAKPQPKPAAPAAAAPAAEPAAPAAVPPVSEPARIAPQPAVRTRAANLGIRPGETRTPKAEEPAPQVEDVYQWTDDAVDQALKQFRLNRAKQR